MYTAYHQKGSHRPTIRHIQNAKHSIKQPAWTLKHHDHEKQSNVMGWEGAVLDQKRPDRNNVISER